MNQYSDSSQHFLNKNYFAFKFRKFGKITNFLSFDYVPIFIKNKIKIFAFMKENNSIEDGLILFCNKYMSLIFLLQV